EGVNPNPPHPPIAGAMGPSLSHSVGEGFSFRGEGYAASPQGSSEKSVSTASVCRYTSRCRVLGGETMQRHASVSRRHLLIGAAALSSVALRPMPLLAAADAPGPNAIPPDEALKRIMDGNARYAANGSTVKDFSAGRAARAK